MQNRPLRAFLHASAGESNSDKRAASAKRAEVGKPNGSSGVDWLGQAGEGREAHGSCGVDWRSPMGEGLPSEQRKHVSQLRNND